MHAPTGPPPPRLCAQFMVLNRWQKLMQYFGPAVAQECDIARGDNPRWMIGLDHRYDTVATIQSVKGGTKAREALKSGVIAERRNDVARSVVFGDDEDGAVGGTGPGIMDKQCRFLLRQGFGHARASYDAMVAAFPPLALAILCHMTVRTPVASPSHNCVALPLGFHHARHFNATRKCPPHLTG